MRRISWQIGAVFALLLVMPAAGVLATSDLRGPLWGATPARAQQSGMALVGAPPPGSAPGSPGSPGSRPQISGPGGGSSVAKPPPPAAPNVVLYDQYNNPGTLSTLSQQFGDLPAYNSQTADNFAVPGGQSWSVSEVDAQGVYFNGPGPATTFNVYFYTSVVSGTYTIPGTPVYTATNQVFSNVAGTFAITLAAPALLPGGSDYFVSAQAVMNFSPGGEWGWTNRTVNSNGPAAWRNGGGGFGSGCVSWDKRTTCTGDPASPDEVFRLVGTVVGGATATPTRTATAVCAGNYGYAVSAGATVVPGTTDTGNHCDDCSTSISLPFPYTLYDQTVTTAQVGSNGFLALGTASNAFNPSCIPVTAATYTIGAYWTDQCTAACTGSTCTGCGIFTSVSGSAPNRIFNVEYRTNYYNSNVALNYEIRLYEGQTHFDVIYGTITTFTPPQARNLSVGVQKNTTQYTLVGCDPTGGQSPPVSSGQRYNYTLGGCGTATNTPTRTQTPTVAATSTATRTNTLTSTPAGATGTPTQTPTACPMTFSDVPPGHPFYDYVLCLYCRGAISGYGDGTFRPYNNTTRGQLAKIVVLGYALPTYTPASPTFNDVAGGSTFYQFVETAYHHSLVSGYACGGPGEPCPGLYFRPNNLVTRGQLSKIVVVAAGWALVNPATPTFNDVAPGSTFYQHVATAYCHQIIAGYTCGGPGEPCPGLYFRPSNNATRGQISKIMCLAVRNLGACGGPLQADGASLSDMR